MQVEGEFDEEAMYSVKRTTSRPFPRSESGPIAVKVIDHVDGKVMKVIGV